MKTLSPQQADLQARSKPHRVVHGDGSVSVIGNLVSGHAYRTALSLERLGLGRLKYQGPSLGWYTAYEDAG